MKTPERVVAEVAKRLHTSWSQVLVGAGWKRTFQLGTSELTGRRLEENWPETHRNAMQWQEWADSAGDGVELTHRSATIHGTTQPLPAALVVFTIDDAAGLVGGDWAVRLDRGRRRHTTLARLFSGLADPASMLRSCDALSDVDFDLVCRAAAYFSSPYPSGLTARQVPVEGMGTKWLDAHQSVVRTLAGVDDLALTRGRPQRLHLTYLDPGHLSSGARRHDLVTIGDVDTIAYQPRVVLISENRDTAQLFPAIDGGVAIEGDGRGPGGIARVAWVRQAEQLHYWGDMDADGLEILQGFRAAGLDVQSVFMDMNSYEHWEKYGVDYGHGGQPLTSRTPREHGLLEPGERELYLALCSPGWARHRRIEQERIPLADAATALGAVSSACAPS